MLLLLLSYYVGRLYQVDVVGEMLLINQVHVKKKNIRHIGNNANELLLRASNNGIQKVCENFMGHMLVEPKLAGDMCLYQL